VSRRYRARTWASRVESLLGAETVRGHLEDPHGTPAHAVTTPAEDDSVDPSWQESLQQYLALFLVEEPADEEVHQAGRSYHGAADKTKESQLRLCEMGEMSVEGL
jgi:hypothetical protein